MRFNRAVASLSNGWEIWTEETSGGPGLPDKFYYVVLPEATETALIKAIRSDQMRVSDPVGPNNLAKFKHGFFSEKKARDAFAEVSPAARPVSQSSDSGGDADPTDPPDTVESDSSSSDDDTGGYQGGKIIESATEREAANVGGGSKAPKPDSDSEPDVVESGRTGRMGEPEQSSSESPLSRFDLSNLSSKQKAAIMAVLGASALAIGG